MFRNLYRVIRTHPEEFGRQFKWLLFSRKIFDWLKMTPTEPLTDIQRASRFYYLQKLSFGGKVQAQTFGTATTTPPRLIFLRLKEDTSQAHLRLHQVFIENLPWQECVKRYDRPHTLFYCDPPYWGTEGYGVDFRLDNYQQMADLARSIKGKLLISVNDIPEMRAVFKGLPMQRLRIKYSVGGAGRSQKESGELLVSNYRLDGR